MAIQYGDTEYIKLFRKMINWEWYTDVNTKVLFLHCLLRANWKPGEWKGIHYERGQFITSLPTLAAETGLTVKMVRTALEHLISTGELASSGQPNGQTKGRPAANIWAGEGQATGKAQGRIITVIHYDEYQVTGKLGAGEGQATGRLGAGEGQQYKKYKEDKESKEDKEIKNITEAQRYFPNDDRLEEAFKDFRKMRKAIKKPMTERAIALMLSKLQKMTLDPDEQVRILEQSITNCWSDIYELKDKRRNGGKGEQTLADKWGIGGL